MDKILCMRSRLHKIQRRVYYRYNLLLQIKSVGPNAVIKC